MICQYCKDGTHQQCRGGTWCECLHRGFEGPAIKLEPIARSRPTPLEVFTELEGGRVNVQWHLNEETVLVTPKGGTELHRSEVERLLEFYKIVIEAPTVTVWNKGKVPKVSLDKAPTFDLDDVQGPDRDGGA